MNVFRKIWVRVLISFLGSGMIGEIFHIQYDSEMPIPLLFFAIIIFLILSGIVLVDKYRHYYFPSKKNPYVELNDSELLSDFETKDKTA